MGKYLIFSFTQSSFWLVPVASQLEHSSSAPGFWLQFPPWPEEIKMHIATLQEDIRIRKKELHHCAECSCRRPENEKSKGKVFAINNCCLSMSRPWAYACLTYQYRYGLKGQLEACGRSSVGPELHVKYLSTCAVLDLCHLSSRLSVCLWKYWIENLLWPKHWY